MNPLAVTLKAIRGGWAIELTNGREIARFIELGAKLKAMRYLAPRHRQRGQPPPLARLARASAHRRRRQLLRVLRA